MLFSKGLLLENLSIRELELSEWELFKQLRLESLHELPWVYTASYEEAAMLPDEAWKEQFLDKRYMLFAQYGNEIVGMVGADVSKEKKRSHTAYITAMYVTPSMRGKGIGSRIFTALMEKLAADETLVRAFLRVTTTQQEAFAMYQQLGFSLIGTAHKELYVNDQYYDLYLMEKMLR